MSDLSRETDERYMRRAIRLAMDGRGYVEPNPTVGCVIVKDNRIIGEGFHRRFGQAHAERDALANCTESPHGAIVYVTLEPCCHTHKKTPPCVPALIEAKVARVVIGSSDPNPQVNGRGAAMLQGAGVEVTSPVLGPTCRQLIAPFIARTTLARPYVTAKWAQSISGQVAGPMGRPVRITNDASNRIVHALRARCDAIAVGTNTVLNDDPLLTARGVEGARPLLRVILSNSLKMPMTARLVQTAGEVPVVVYSSESATAAAAERVAELRQSGVEVVALPDTEGHFSLNDALTDLHRRNVTHLLIEPGPTLTRYLLARHQLDRVWIFRSPREIESAEGFASSMAPQVEYPIAGELGIEGDVLTEYLNPLSPTFHALTPSADFVLTADSIAK